jgi:hypothetical protein
MRKLTGRVVVGLAILAALALGGPSASLADAGGVPNGGCYGALVSENARETHRGEGVSAFATDPQFGLKSYGEYVQSFKSILC